MPPVVEETRAREQAEQFIPELFRQCRGHEISITLPDGVQGMKRGRAGGVLPGAEKRGIPGDLLKNDGICWGSDAFVSCGIVANSVDGIMVENSNLIGRRKRSEACCR